MRTTRSNTVAPAGEEKLPALGIARWEDGILSHGDLALPLETSSLVLRYLPLRDLSAMALVSKGSRASITTEMVVQAAYMRTGDRNNTRKSMDELYNLMSANSIHVPSPMRLLRIATGNRCEFCNCRHTTVGPWSFGTFSCWTCVSERGNNSISKPWNTTWVRYFGNEDGYDAIFNHPRNAVSKLYGKKYYVWREQRIVAGEKIGPILTWEDIDGVVSRMRDAQEPDEYVQTIDGYIADHIGAPSAEEYAEFIRAYLAAKVTLEERTDRAAREKAERKRIREERKRKREAEQLAKEERKRKREAAKKAKEAAKRAKISDGCDQTKPDEKSAQTNSDDETNDQSQQKPAAA